MTIDEFKVALLELGIDITSDQLDKLDKYYKLLIDWNDKINLTSITKKEDVYLKHFYDSLTIFKAVNLYEVSSLADLGTGAGFPGMVLKIVFPKLKLDLIDSRGKRTEFLKLVKEELKLDDLNIITARAEDYAKEVREKYDVVTARAVAPLNILVEYALPITRVKGFFVPLKANCDDEIENISQALKTLDCNIETIIKFKLPRENSNRTIIKILKNKTTSNKYPRTYKEIKKKPL